MHGIEQQVTLGGNRVTLYPLFHPAAALYTPSMQTVLASDFARIPELLARHVEVPVVEAPPLLARREPEPVLAETIQLGLF